ncbi:MAG: GNAT family N-acetyltransferase [Clostridia bacterium]|nr:GNAT family N-acetyltransferase [Clostridia bacterium]MBQ1434979.1 GNAT family N-acetyltransferase [Clostridia bacterium]
MHIRTAREGDLDVIAAVEAECFPPAEAASRGEFAERLRVYGGHFLLLFEGDELISFVDGFVTDQPDITDEMYACADMHDENGAWQMIFGVNTRPRYRRRGYAGELIKRMINDARAQGRRGVVLTCKARLTAYYAGFGFINEGLSEKSRHGGAEWYQMRLTF